jgi:hypothetical protein
MGKAVFDGSNRELALHMKLRLKTPGRKEIAIDPSEPQSEHLDEEARSAVATENTRISFQGPGRRLAADDAHGVGRIDGFGHVSAAVDDLAIVTMAVKLGDRFAGNFDFDRAAAAGDSHRFGHGLASNRGGAARAWAWAIGHDVDGASRIGPCRYRVDGRDKPGHDGGRI